MCKSNILVPFRCLSSSAARFVLLLIVVSCFLCVSHVRYALHIALQLRITSGIEHLVYQFHLETLYEVNQVRAVDCLFT